MSMNSATSYKFCSKWILSEVGSHISCMLHVANATCLSWSNWNALSCPATCCWPVARFGPRGTSFRRFEGKAHPQFLVKGKLGKTCKARCKQSRRMKAFMPRWSACKVSRFSGLCVSFKCFCGELGMANVWACLGGLHHASSYAARRAT